MDFILFCFLSVIGLVQAGDHGTIDIDITVDLDHRVGQKIKVLQYQ
jgi:hypothetical protein